MRAATLLAESRRMLALPISRASSGESHSARVRGRLWLVERSATARSYFRRARRALVDSSKPRALRPLASSGCSARSTGSTRNVLATNARDAPPAGRCADEHARTLDPPRLHYSARLGALRSNDRRGPPPSLLRRPGDEMSSAKPNGKSEPIVPSEVFVVVFEDGCITCFVTKRDAETFQNQIRRPTRLERFVLHSKAASK